MIEKNRANGLFDPSLLKQVLLGLRFMFMLTTVVWSFVGGASPTLSFGLGIGQDTRFGSDAGYAFSGDVEWGRGHLAYGISGRKFLSSQEKLTGIEVVGGSIRYTFLRFGAFVGARFVDEEDRKDTSMRDRMGFMTSGVFGSIILKTWDRVAIEIETLYENANRDESLSAGLISQIMVKLDW